MKTVFLMGSVVRLRNTGTSGKCDKLMTFERKIMRKILCYKRTYDGYWKIKTNREINDILKGQNIIGSIKNKD